MRLPRLTKALGLVLGFACSPAACSSESVVRPPPPPADWASLEVRSARPDAGAPAATTMERAVTSAYIAALSSAGFKDLLKVLDEEAHFSFAGFRDVHGRENIVKIHETLLGAFDDRRFGVTRVLLTDSAQAVEWSMTGVQRASKKPVGFRGASLLWTKDDGSISDLHLYFDEAVASSQTGAGPKGLAPVPLAKLPSEGRNEIEQTRSSEEGANVATVRAALDALEAKNETAYLGAMTDGVEVTTLEGAPPLRGKADVRAAMKALHKSIGDLDTSIDNVWGVGPFVAVEYHIVGEQRGPVGWVPAQKDTLLKMFVLDVVELQNGRIARITRYDNPSQILSAP
jgi:ketosteroid isomerase-like protein